MFLNLLLILLIPGWALLLVGFLTAPYGSENEHGFRRVPVPAHGARRQGRRVRPDERW